MSEALILSYRWTRARALAADAIATDRRRALAFAMAASLVIILALQAVGSLLLDLSMGGLIEGGEAVEDVELATGLSGALQSIARTFPVTLLCAVGMALGLFEFWRGWVQSRFLQTAGKQRLEIGPEGVRVSSESSEALHRWSAVKGVRRGRRGLALICGLPPAVFVPADALPEGLSLDEAEARILRWREGAA